MPKRRPPRLFNPRPTPRVVRRFDSLGRRYFLDVGAGKRVRKDAWEVDLERRRAERGEEPRPRVPTETHPVGRGGEPFPKGVDERGVPELDDLPDEPPDEPTEVSDEADYEEGGGA